MLSVIPGSEAEVIRLSHGESFTFTERVVGQRLICLGPMHTKRNLVILTIVLTAILGFVTGCCTLFPSMCKPIILEQPQSQVVLLGGVATFTVVAAHPPPNTNAPLTYQWTLNGVAIPGATSTSFTTSPVGLANLSDVYRVIVSGSPSTTSDPAFLSIATVTGNSGVLQTQVSSFTNTNTPGNSCPHSFDRFFVYTFFNGPNVPPSLQTPSLANNTGQTRLQIDTCHAQNASGNITAAKIVQNNIQAKVLACDDNGSTTCTVFPSPSTHSNADANNSIQGSLNLPVETDTRGLVRVIVYVKSTSLAPGQTYVFVNWAYHN